MVQGVPSFVHSPSFFNPVLWTLKLPTNMTVQPPGIFVFVILYLQTLPRKREESRDFPKVDFPR